MCDECHGRPAAVDVIERSAPLRHRPSASQPQHHPLPDWIEDAAAQRGVEARTRRPPIFLPQSVAGPRRLQGAAISPVSRPETRASSEE